MVHYEKASFDSADVAAIKVNGGPHSVKPDGAEILPGWHCTQWLVSKWLWSCPRIPSLVVLQVQEVVALMLCLKSGLDAFFCRCKTAAAHDIKVEDVQVFFVDGASASENDWKLLCNVLR